MYIVNQEKGIHMSYNCTSSDNHAYSLVFISQFFLDVFFVLETPLLLSLLALCTVLHLTERLLLDHPHRLTGSKVQYVRLT